MPWFRGCWSSLGAGLQRSWAAAATVLCRRREPRYSGAHGPDLAVGRARTVIESTSLVVQVRRDRTRRNCGTEGPIRSRGQVKAGSGLLPASPEMTIDLRRSCRVCLNRIDVPRRKGLISPRGDELYGLLVGGSRV